MGAKMAYDESPSGVDHQDRLLIPCYDDFFGIPLEIIPFHLDRELRVLELGAGTGSLSAKIAARYPNARLTLVDASPAVLRAAEEKFSIRDATRVTFQVIDYAAGPLKGTYDLVLSTLSLHHLPDDSKAEVFRKVYRTLEPGGLFINADLVLGENVLAEKVCNKIWLRKIGDTGSLTSAQKKMKGDRMSALASQLSQLKQVGFVDITTWYRYYNFTVYSATRSLGAVNEPEKSDPKEQR